MANIERVKKKYTTGKGVLVGYLALTKPSKQYGNYSANILLSKEEGSALVAQLKELRKEQFKICNNKGTLKDLPCIPYTTYDEASGENIPDGEGRYILKTTNKAYNKDGKLVFKTQFINAQKEFITGDISAGEGTIAKLSLVFEGYKAGANVGISAKLLGGQIINLVAYSNKPSISLSDFEEEEGYDGVGEDFSEDTEAQDDNIPEVDDEEEDF